MWIALAAGIVTPVAAYQAAGPVYGLIEPLRNRFTEDAAFDAFTFVVCLLPLQLALAAGAVLAAWLSGGGVRWRLGLVRPRVRGGVVLLAATGGLFPVYVGFWLRNLLFVAPSPHLEWWVELLSGTPAGWIGVVILAVTVLPAACEELLYRGCVLRSLARGWHPLIAIVVSAALFAAIHADLQHITAVAPAGLWLSYVAWRADSLFPSVAVHGAWNLVVCALCRMELATMEALHPALHALVLGLALPAFLCAVFGLERRRAGAARSR